MCFPFEASALWNKYKDSMNEDILHRNRITNENLNTELFAEIYNEALIIIEDICNAHPFRRANAEPPSSRYQQRCST